VVRSAKTDIFWLEGLPGKSSRKRENPEINSEDINSGDTFPPDSRGAELLGSVVSAEASYETLSFFAGQKKICIRLFRLLPLVQELIVSTNIHMKIFSGWQSEIPHLSSKPSIEKRIIFLEL
jgi:hypothetical protein